MILYANAKINLGLRVLRRREDGFHDIETVFVPYDGMRDLIEITPDYGTGATLISDNLPWTADKDMTVRAYNLLRQDFDMPGVRIRLTKHIPAGSGLGGGSADAAFVIKALNKMFSLGLDDKGMASYAAVLGSDCAFFVHNRPMLASGRGDVLTPADMDLSGYRIKVIVPEDISVNTAQAYRDLDAAAQGAPKDGAPAYTEGTSLSDIIRIPAGMWRDCLHNDFEDVIFPLHPELERIKTSLYEAGAVYASMSGSGSAVYALFAR